MISLLLNRHEQKVEHRSAMVGAGPASLWDLSTSRRLVSQNEIFFAVGVSRILVSVGEVYGDRCAGEGAERCTAVD